MESKQKKTVYFVRHGQSVDNTSPVFQSVNSPLSEKGIRQAKNIAKRLSTLQFESLISSPVQRALETAQQIADKTGKQVVHSDLFVERVKPSEIDVSHGVTRLLMKFGDNGKNRCTFLVHVLVTVKIMMTLLHVQTKHWHI